MIDSAKPKVIQMDATLAFRRDEVFTIHADKPAAFEAARFFGVAIVKTPPLPGPREIMYREVEPIAVICATFFPALEGWGFVQMEPSTKEQIGDSLVNHNAQPGRWYWLEMNPDPPEPDGL